MNRQNELNQLEAIVAEAERIIGNSSLRPALEELKRQFRNRISSSNRITTAEIHRMAQEVRLLLRRRDSNFNNNHRRGRANQIGGANPRSANNSNTESEYDRIRDMYERERNGERLTANEQAELERLFEEPTRTYSRMLFDMWSEEHNLTFDDIQNENYEAIYGLFGESAPSERRGRRTPAQIKRDIEIDYTEMIEHGKRRKNRRIIQLVNAAYRCIRDMEPELGLAAPVSDNVPF